MASGFGGVVYEAGVRSGSSDPEEYADVDDRIEGGCLKDRPSLEE
jgi:hypothetical protein